MTVFCRAPRLNWLSWVCCYSVNTNVIVMLGVLGFSKHAAVDQLAELADLIEIGDRADTPSGKADNFINAIVQLNESFGIGAKLDAIRIPDITAIATRAVKEGAGYPVSKLMDQQECEQMIRAMCL